jgi:myo-inositol-1(or 4)-monophosphatase
MDYNAVLQDVITIATSGGKIALDYFRKPIQMSTKLSNIDIVTEADKAVEVYIAAEILARYPDHHLVGEEGGGQGAVAQTAEYFWYVDPIDGTTNFASGIPYFSVSIALTDVNRTPLVGVVYDVSRDSVYAAVKGQGATLNGEPLRVTQNSDLINAVLITGFPYDRATNPDNNLREWNDFILQARCVRCMGSAALDLAYVASGRADGYWERGLNPWDVLAGMLLVEEAGGKVTDYAGGASPQNNPQRRYLASNGHLHETMIAVLNEGER